MEGWDEFHKDMGKIMVDIEQTCLDMAYEDDPEKRLEKAKHVIDESLMMISAMESLRRRIWRLENGGGEDERT